MTKYLTLVFKNVLRSKRRNILTILSIAVSLFIFSVLVSLPTFANQMLKDTTSSVRIISRTKMGLGYPLPVAYKPKIAAIPHVVQVAALVIYGGIYHEASDQFPSVATEAKEIDMWSDWGITGMDDFKKIKTACLVADGTMRRFNLHEVIHAGDTPIGPHINLLRFCSNAWKLIAGLMVDAAVNHECSNLNYMGNCGNFRLVCYRQGITQSHLGTADDANGGGCISEHLVGKRRQAHQHREDKERYCNRKNREDISAFAAEQAFENQCQIFRHISLLRLCGNLDRGSRLCGCAAFFRSNEYTLVQAVNGVHETLGTRVVGDHHNSFVKLCLELCQQD